MNEYIVIKNFDNISKYILSLPKKVKNIKIGQVRSDSRFNNKNKFVTDITNAEINKLNREHSNKNIYNVENTISIMVHSIKSKGYEYVPPIEEIWFNHYKLNRTKYKYLNNLNSNIKKQLDNYSFLNLSNTKIYE
jgi:hypothetical protein